MSKYLKNLHKPCDKLDKYDNESYMQNPLLKLNLDEIRRYRRQSRYELSAIKVSLNYNLVSKIPQYPFFPV